WLNATPCPPTTSVSVRPSNGATTAAAMSKLMSSRAFHCWVVNSRVATQVPNGRRPLSNAGTNATLRCAAPFSLTQCPAVITTLSLALVTAVPEQEALAPWAVVKNSRPLVRTTAPPSVQRRPRLSGTAACRVAPPRVDPRGRPEVRWCARADVPPADHGPPRPGRLDRARRGASIVSIGCAASIRCVVQYCRTFLRSDDESAPDHRTGRWSAAC